MQHPAYNPNSYANAQAYTAQMAQYPAAPQQVNTWLTPQQPAGPQGPAGPQRPAGPQGPAGPQQPAGPVHVKRRQSIKTHILLACTTMGLGNILYSRLCNSDTLSKVEW